MIELTKEVLDTMDSYADDQEFFAYKVSNKDGKSLYHSYYEAAYKADKNRVRWWITIPYEGPTYQHEVGAVFECATPDIRKSMDCGAGVNVGTFDFASSTNTDWAKAYSDYLEDTDWFKAFFPLRTWKVKFTKKDIACIPDDIRGVFSQDGNLIPGAKKIRLYRCEVIEEIT